MSLNVKFRSKLQIEGSDLNINKVLEKFSYAEYNSMESLVKDVMKIFENTLSLTLMSSDLYKSAYSLRLWFKGLIRRYGYHEISDQYVVSIPASSTFHPAYFNIGANISRSSEITKQHWDPSYQHPSTYGCVALSVERDTDTRNLEVAFQILRYSDPDNWSKAQRLRILNLFYENISTSDAYRDILKKEFHTLLASSNSVEPSDSIQDVEDANLSSIKTIMQVALDASTTKVTCAVTGMDIKHLDASTSVDWVKLPTSLLTDSESTTLVALDHQSYALKTAVSKLIGARLVAKQEAENLKVHELKT
jgi:hypothetical protein